MHAERHALHSSRSFRFTILLHPSCPPKIMLWNVNTADEKPRAVTVGVVGASHFRIKANALFNTFPQRPFHLCFGHNFEYFECLFLFQYRGVRDSPNGTGEYYSVQDEVLPEQSPLVK